MLYGCDALRGRRVERAAHQLRVAEQHYRVGGVPLQPQRCGRGGGQHHRPNAKPQTDYFNLDGKFKVNDRLTLTGQIGLHPGPRLIRRSAAVRVRRHRPAASATRRRATAWRSVVHQHKSGERQACRQRLGVERVLHPSTTSSTPRSTATTGSTDGVCKDVEVRRPLSRPHPPGRAWDRGCTMATLLLARRRRRSPTVQSDVLIPAASTAARSAMPGLLTNPWSSNQVDQSTSVDSTKTLPALAHTDSRELLLAWSSSRSRRRTIAGYAMAHVGGDRWRGNFGVRVWSTPRRTPTSTYPDPSSGTTPGRSTPSDLAVRPVLRRRPVKHDYFDVLPSANLTFDLQPNLLLRVSAGRDHVAAGLQRARRHREPDRTPTSPATAATPT